ncbi:DNA-binding IclR family transcriptional regulator [Paraburkholderia sp. MM5496-R1]|uniref:transcriptional regulator n=1 Tax=unclassified Paraburkholderia TaxID=2615204 RepID=UPI003D195114
MKDDRQTEVESGTLHTHDPELQLVELLVELWQAQQASPDKPWSLAKLSKRSQLPMSTLRRLLTELGTAGLVDVTIHPDGTGSATLTTQGLDLCTELLPA